MKLCQERVEDHQALNQSLEETSEHLEEAEEGLKPLKDLSGDRSSIDEKLRAVEVGYNSNQDLLLSRYFEFPTCKKSSCVGF